VCYERIGKHSLFVGEGASSLPCTSTGQRRAFVRQDETDETEAKIKRPINPKRKAKQMHCIGNKCSPSIVSGCRANRDCIWPGCDSLHPITSASPRLPRSSAFPPFTSHSLSQTRLPPPPHTLSCTIPHTITFQHHTRPCISDACTHLALHRGLVASAIPSQTVA
jgi:hypothetical protein